jgi:hypothetical protein
VPPAVLVGAAASALVVFCLVLAGNGQPAGLWFGAAAAAGLAAGACARWRIPVPALTVTTAAVVVAYFSHYDPLWGVAFFSAPVLSLSGYARSGFVLGAPDRTSRVLATIAGWLAPFYALMCTMPTLGTPSLLALALPPVYFCALAGYSAACEASRARWIRRVREGKVPEWTAAEIGAEEPRVLLVQWQPSPTHYREACGPAVEIRVQSEEWHKVWLLGLWSGAWRALLAILGAAVVFVVAIMQLMQ